MTADEIYILVVAAAGVLGALASWLRAGAAQKTANRVDQRTKQPPAAGG